jgi:hypothetical protein
MEVALRACWDMAALAGAPSAAKRLEETAPSANHPKRQVPHGRRDEGELCVKVLAIKTCEKRIHSI